MKVNVPEDLVEEVEGFVEKRVNEKKIQDLLTRLQSEMNHAEGGAWIHAEIAYGDPKDMPLAAVLNRIGVAGWSLAAMGPVSYVVRNKRGGRGY